MNQIKKNFQKNNDVQKFYDRIIRLASNREEGLFPPKIHKQIWSKFHTEDEYENSLKNSILFSKKYSPEQKKSFQCILVHNNADGIMSGYIAWHYLTNGGKEQRNLKFFRIIPDRIREGDISHQIKRIAEELKGKSVLMCDLSYNDTTYKYIHEISSFFISIDNHYESKLDYHFIVDEHHGSCAGVWKFFYPEKRVPYYIQYVDAGDSNSHPKYLPQINAFMTSFNVRFVKNQRRKDYFYTPEILFEDMNDFFGSSYIQGVNFLVVIGQIMTEFRENMKSEVARNATKAFFHGKNKKYNIYVLNYSQPGLSKAVAKNIAELHKNEAEFAIVWHYDHNKDQFDFTLSTNHDNTNPNLPNIPKLIQEMRLSGGGTGKHTGHFVHKGDLSDFKKFITKI